jgi:hypothetical protein
MSGIAPGLDGYLTMSQQNREQEAAQLTKATQLMSLRSAFTQAEEGAKAREIMKTETDPAKVIQALMQLGPTGAAAAHQYATAIKEAQTAKALQDLTKGGALNMDDPDALMRASMIPGMAHLGPEAERLRKVRENKAALATLRDAPPQMLPAGAVAPGTNQQTVQPVPAEDMGAFLKVANGQATSASPEAGDAAPGGGLFTSLMTSKNPAIANQAKMMQGRLNASGESVPAAHWIDIQKQLAGQEASFQQAQSMLERRNASGTGVVPEAHTDLHGKDYLGTLPAGVASTVQGIAEGRIPITSLSTKGGHREAMLERVTQYDPKFNAATYQQRSKVQQDFTSGQAARNVTAINTAIGHLGSMSDLGDALQNGSTQAINAAVNAVSSQFGRPEVNNYDLAKTAVGDEMMRVFRQVGASQQEADAWKQKFSSANSPEKIKGAVKTAVELLQSRIDALDDQWKRGMGTDEGYPNLLSPKSQAVLARVAPKAAAAAGGAYSDAEKERRYQDWKAKQGK